MPIWASGILCFIPIAQQNIFPVSQATKLNRHLGPHFEIPSASCSVVSLITIGIWLPFYELFVQPALAKITKQKEGLTSLQKIILGNMFSNLAMVTAGLVEGHRRGVAISLGAPMFATWLAPQFILLGFCQHRLNLMTTNDSLKLFSYIQSYSHILKYSISYSKISFYNRFLQNILLKIQLNMSSRIF